MKKSKQIALSAMIAALYTTLTLFSSLFGLSSGIVQVRFSEALCVLPIFTPAAVPGITVGCLLSNILCGGTVYDIIFGTLATLIGTLAVLLMRKRTLKYFASLPTIISNTTIIPTVLIISTLGDWSMYPYLAMTVGIGEIISCGIFGTVLIIYFEHHPKITNKLFAFKTTKN